MKNKKPLKIIKTWIPSILAGISFLIDISLNFYGDSLQYLYWATIIFLVIQIIIIKGELDETNKRKPNIVVDGFELERPFHLFRNNQPAEILERYYIKFRNNKLPGKSICDTDPIHAIVSFYNTDLTIVDSLSHEKPFWLDRSGPPWERPDNFNLIISSSSKPEALCLFARQQGGSDIFVFNDNSYNSNVRSLEPYQDSLRIPYIRFFICIRLKAGNLDMQPIWISVINQGENKKLLMEEIHNPIIKV